MSEEVPVLRTYREAPVIETVLSIQFSPLTKLSVPHFGLYWERIRQHFPLNEMKPPIMHIVEDFPGPQSSPPGGLEEFPNEKMVRYWFLTERKDSFVQLQQDRFLYNWQRIEPSDPYPRYQNIRQNFLVEWNAFLQFLEAEKLPRPEVDQCEVTYVNHIPYDDGWKTYRELNRVVSYWSGRTSGQWLPDPEKVTINLRYKMPDHLGRLYISLQPVIRARDGVEVLQLNLTARGAPVSSKTEDIFKWLNQGRTWIVEGFTDFITPHMQERWGLQK
jgi:uncharacterized protein (TIGR04255 family)